MNVYSQQEVKGTDAHFLAKEFPGLFVTKDEGDNSQLKVTEARSHEKLLEKVVKLSGYQS